MTRTFFSQLCICSLLNNHGCILFFNLYFNRLKTSQMLGELMSELEKLNLEMLTFTMKKGKFNIKFYK